MRLTTKGRFAVTAMIDLALRQDNGPVTLQKLVDDQHANGIEIEDKPATKRAISSAPVVKPIRINAPNSVFALGGITTK